MRAFWLCIVALGLAVSPAMAGTGAGGDKDSAGNGAANTAAKSDPAPKESPSSLEIENELQQMRDLLQAQSKQLQQQDEQIREQKEQMQALQDQLTTHASSDTESSSAVAAPVNAPIGPSTGIVSNGNSGPSLDQESGTTPTSINIKGISLTPMGFMAAETVWRQKALAADVNTPLNSIPFDGSPNAHLSEFQASGRQSRIAMLVEGKLSNVKIGGYYETDFLSAGTTSTPTESNSYTLRQRQFWGQAAFSNGITFTGGQMWSLITETTKGMDNRTEANPSTVDSQYNVGFSWARQYGARITKNFNNKVWLGFSVEQSTPTVTVHGNATAQAAAPTLACTTPSTNNCSATGTYALPINLNPTFVNFLFGSFGTSSGLYNPLGNYGYNEAPDFVVKAVWEPGFGHYEIFGVFGEVHDRAYPCVLDSATIPGCTGANPALSAFGAFNKSAGTGGVGGNAKWNLFAKHVDLGVHFLGGAGIGRYGSGTLSDLTVRPDGTPVPIHNFQALGTLILHPTPKLDVYMYVGGEFEERTGYIKSGSTRNEGYGYASLNNSGCWTETLPLTSVSTSTNLAVPTGVGGTAGFIPGPLSNCTGDTRNLLEGTLGFWYRFYKGPKGTFQYGMQYSNIDRNTWRGVGGAVGTISASGQPHADENEVFTSFRYYLP
jgi:TolA-binding protein